MRSNRILSDRGTSQGSTRNSTICPSLMLRYLKIANLAIVDQVEVEFREGFNVLTGETGTGKSILIGALDLALGGKCSGDMVRSGADEAQVEALFEIPEGIALPEAIKLDIALRDEMVLTRKILPSGRSRCFIDGNLVSSEALRKTGQILVSIFGQHEHHVLTDPEEHLDVLERFGDLKELRRLTSEAYMNWKKAEKDLTDAENKLAALEREITENAVAQQELEKASLKPGEDELIHQERERLRSSVQIRERAFEAYHAMYSKSGSLIEGFAEVRKAVEFLASADTRLSGLRENLEDAVYRIEDVALELRDVAERTQSDPGRLEFIEERLALIRRLKKKYGTDLNGLISLQDALAEESGRTLEAASQVKKLRTGVDSGRLAYLEAAGDLSSARRSVAETLEVSMKQELEDLAMPNAQFIVSFTDIGPEKSRASGLEKVEFFLASNPGEAARPMARIASGGELSRIMLALKALQVEPRGASTVIFDEVDSGIGGHTAFAVGSRLARVARRQQVLCVTHLHQIAALADHHLSVRKSVDQGRTHIEVTALDRDKRVGELARMLGASPDSESVREHVTRLMDLGSAGVSG